MTDTTLPTPVDARPSRPLREVGHRPRPSTTSSPSGPGAPSSRPDRRSRATRRPRSSPTCARPPRRPWSRSPRRARLTCAGRRAATARRRPRGLDQRQRRLVQGRCSTPSSTSSSQRRVAGEPDRRRDRRQGHRRRDGRPARLPLEQDARPVRPRPGWHAAAAPRRPQHRRGRAALEVEPTDFRRWVAMHEETHRVQFTAVPWLRDHLVARSQSLAVDLAPTPEELGKRFEQLTKNLPEVMSLRRGASASSSRPPSRRPRSPSSPPSCPCSRATPTSSWTPSARSIIPSVDEIRRKFDARRSSAVGVDRLLRKLLGLEAKMRQYRDGAVFVRAVTDQVGRDGFNAVWSSPDTLPKRRRDPRSQRLGAPGPRLSDARSSRDARSRSSRRRDPPRGA